MKYKTECPAGKQSVGLGEARWSGDQRWSPPLSWPSSSHCVRDLILTGYPRAPHVSQTPCCGCCGTRFSWETVGESDVFHFCNETMKNARETHRSLYSPAIFRWWRCVLTQRSHKIEAACIAPSLHEECHPVESPSAHWTHSMSKK